MIFIFILKVFPDLDNSNDSHTMSWDAQRISTPMKRVRNSRAVGSFLWFYLLGRGREITGVWISNLSDKSGASEAVDRGAIPPLDPPNFVDIEKRTTFSSAPSHPHTIFWTLRRLCKIFWTYEGSSTNQYQRYLKKYIWQSHLRIWEFRRSS